MLKLHNTLTRRLEPFVPLDPDHVRLYVCGPTVYSFAHIGNARPTVVFDVLNRFLRKNYKNVTFVRNITDIDDKIIVAAKENGESIETLTTRTTAYFHQEMEALGNLFPDIEPHATQHVEAMITLIQCLIDKGHAYAQEGHALFSVDSFPQYGQLSRCNREEMLAGARVEVAPYKRNPGDFVLWKPSSPDMPGWESPWGRGRPGWHIECSAMASTYLGETFDIHGGGQDLMFPHHENEIAQSQACFGPETFARTWLHNGMLTVDGQKMSKSLGNIIVTHDLLKRMPGELIRFILLSTHYRQGLDWTDQAVAQARTSLDRLYNALRGRDLLEEVSEDPSLIAALEDDLNTPLAISVLHDLAGRIHKAETLEEKNHLASQLKKSALCLGLLQHNPESWFKEGVLLSEEEIQKIMAEREGARDRKDFQEADRLRDILLDNGITLEDTASGTTWRRQT